MNSLWHVSNPLHSPVSGQAILADKNFIRTHMQMAKVREEHHRKLDKEARLKKAKDKADMKRRKERLEEEVHMHRL